MNNELFQSFEKLLDTIYSLREKCPWDHAQTQLSIRPLTIEETYELAQAIINDDVNDIKKELGDLLLHIVLYARMAEEKNQFNLKDVFETLNDKLVFRHPHIFSNYKAETPEEVSKMWEEVKLKEKGGNKTVLSGIPDALPALVKAYRIQDKARGAGFDWDNRGDVWNKVEEELNEFKSEIEKADQEKAEREFGDFLFSIINAGRLYNINPENALEYTNIKFIKRFNLMERFAAEQNKRIKDLTPNQLDQLWERAKSEENL